MFHKKTCVVLVFLLTMVCLFGLYSVTSAQKTVLKVWTDFSNPPRKDALEQIAADFMKENPDIEVIHQGFDRDNYDIMLQTALLSDDVPDVARLNISYLKQLISNNLVTDITEWYEQEIKDRFTPGTDGQIRFMDGKVYYLPWAAVVVNGINYNRDVTDSVGIDADSIEYWDEYYDALLKLKSAGYIPQAYAVGEGADFLGAHLFENIACRLVPLDVMDSIVNNGGEDYSHPGFLQAMEIIAEINEEGLVTEGAAMEPRAVARGAFLAGKAGFWQEGSWSIYYLYETPDLNFGIIEFPKFRDGAGNQDLAIVSVAENMGIPVNSKNKELAKRFLEFAYRKEVQEKYVEATQSISLVKGAITSENSGYVLQFYADLMAESEAQRALLVDRLHPELYSTTNKAVQGVLTGTMTPEEAVDWINQVYHQIIVE